MPPARPFRPLARLAGPVLVALTLVAVTGCGGGEDVSQDTFEKDLRERTTVSAPLSKCLTDAIYDTFDQSEVNKIYRAASEDELTDATREKLDDLNQACVAETGGDDEESTTTTEDVPTTSEGGSTTDVPAGTGTTTGG